jgi:hypothetical protein
MLGNHTVDLVRGRSISPETTTTSQAVAFLEYVCFMIAKWWTVVVVGFGLPGNVMSLMITLKKDNRRISTCVYMASLAIVDTCVLFFSEIGWKFPIFFSSDEGLKGNLTFVR